jgi:hypothetical protein
MFTAEIAATPSAALANQAALLKQHRQPSLQRASRETSPQPSGNLIDRRTGTVPGDRPADIVELGLRYGSRHIRW